MENTIFFLHDPLVPMSTTTSSRILLCLDRLNEEGASDALMHHACDRLRRLTKVMLRNFPAVRRWEETDDVLQNAVLRLHQSLQEVRPASVQAFFGLATTQIRRTLIDLARHHFGPAGAAAHHESDRYDGMDRIEETAEKSTEPSTLAEWSEFHQAIELLPEREREVVHLLWYQGLTQMEAASVLGVNVRSVKRRWLSARHLLSTALDGKRPES